MGKNFFGGWKLWEKLCFVLAIAIVFTVILGAAKLVYTHWRLRKYTAVAEKEKREQAIQRQMSQRRRHDEVPFGIRALENGIETEGVWVSRPNTPERRSRESSAGSLVLKQYRPGSEDLDLEKQILPRTHQRAGSQATALNSNPPGNNFGRSVSAERASHGRASRDSSPDTAITKPARTRHPPLSYAKYSNTPYAHRYSSTQTSLESLEAAQRASMEAIRRASTSIHHDSHSNSDESSSSGHDAEPISAAAPRLFTQAVPRPRQQSMDFDLMQTHRLSQAAETGQLTPRVRKPGQSRDSSVASIPRSVENGDYFGGHGRSQRAPSESSSPVNPFSTPKIDALPAAVRRSSMPDVTPFAQFCQTAPHSPRPVSQGVGAGVRRPSDSPSAYASASSSPVMQPQRVVAPPPSDAVPPSTAERRPSEPKRSSFEKRPSPVVRGHGTGFEILKPGSLGVLQPDEHPLQRQRAAPPISLHNAYRPRSSSANSGRKLQKKRRASIDSMTSSESGRKSRNSVF